MLAEILRKSSHLIAQYMWLLNIRMLSTNSQVKWTHQRYVPRLLYSLIYPWVHCQVLQFEKHRLTKVSGIWSLSYWPSLISCCSFPYSLLYSNYTTLIASPPPCAKQFAEAFIIFSLLVLYIFTIHLPAPHLELDLLGETLHLCEVFSDDNP